MSIENLIFGVNSVTASYLICYDSLLQNVTDIITKCDSYFITNCDRSLLQSASGFLLQNATVLLQNATVITNCDVYYKLRQYKVESIYLFKLVLSWSVTCLTTISGHIVANHCYGGDKSSQNIS